MKFGDRFTRVLREDISDQGAAQSVMDKPDTYDQISSDVQGDPRAAQHHQLLLKQQKQVREWVNQLESFVKYLNGLEGDSMQAVLNDAECDTLFADIARGENKKISRAAQDLSRLSESLKGYLLSAED